MAEQETDLRRRKYPRVKESCHVKYRVIEEPVMRPEEQGGVAVNISGGGMCFTATQDLASGTMLALEMKLPELPTPVVALAHVVWCDLAGTPGAFDVGVEFWWIGWADEEVQDQMLKYIHQKLDELGISDSGEAS